jgi:lipase
MTISMLHVHEFGNRAGHPVMALHGIRGHGARWRRLAEGYLSDRYVLAPDLRGHGRSAAAPPWTVERHVTDLLTILDEQELPAVDIVAHSFGGLIGVHLAQLARDRVRRLVLLDPSIGLDPEKLLEQARGALSVPSFGDVTEARTALAAGWPEASPQAVDDEIADHLEHGVKGRLRWRFEAAAVVAACSEMARTPILPPGTVPTLLVIAQRSGFVRREFVADCRTALGDGLTVAELDSGHMIYLERFHEVGTLIGQFLARAE